MAGHEGHGDRGRAGRRVAHAAVHHRGEVPSGDDRRKTTGVGPRGGAVGGRDVEPDRQRDSDGDKRQEHVEADGWAGQRDGQPGRHRQTLAEVCRRVIPAEEGPLPADDCAVLQGVDPVQRELQEPGPVVVEGNLVPQPERKRRQKCRGQHRAAGSRHAAGSRWSSRVPRAAAPTSRVTSVAAARVMAYGHSRRPWSAPGSSAQRPVVNRFVQASARAIASASLAAPPESG